MIIQGMDSPAERRGTNSVKWDTCGPEELALWVADMDFAMADCAVEAIQSRLGHRFFGYTFASDLWKSAVQGWCTRRQGWTPESPLPLQGVMSGLGAAIRTVVPLGSTVLVESPVYHPFFSLPPALGYGVESVPLGLHTAGLPDQYGNRPVTMERDLQALEERLRMGGVGGFILCNPHNPGGRVWSEHELRALGELLVNYDIPLIVDEIHGDLTRLGTEFYSFGRLIQGWYQAGRQEKDVPRVIVLQSPTKTFNCAGISSAWAWASTPELQRKLGATVNGLGQEVINLVSYTAAEALYSQGDPWLDQVRGYIDGNIAWFHRHIGQETQDRNARGAVGFTSMVPRAGYLYWLGTGGTTDLDSKGLVQAFRSRGLRVNPGSQFGDGGEGYLRINLACHKDVLARAWDILRSI